MKEKLLTDDLEKNFIIIGTLLQLVYAMKGCEGSGSEGAYRFSV
jgi:hypothetical protein